MAAPAEKLGMRFTHTTLRVHDAAKLVNFYTEKFGMTLMGEKKSTNGEVHYFLGYGGKPEQGKPNPTWHDKRMFLELVQNAKKTRAYGGGSSGIYWKIGITLADVNLAANRLKERSVPVGPGSQFKDIGFLTHTADPENFSIELLQHTFGPAFKSAVKVIPDEPLGQKAALGMVTLRCANIEQSLEFYEKVCGMKFVSEQPVEDYGFSLYFLAYTEDVPPNPKDLKAVKNREWLWAKEYQMIELQHVRGSQSKYVPLREGEAGFAGLRFFAPDLAKARAQIEGAGYPVKDSGPQDEVYGAPYFVVADPDGTPVTFHEMEKSAGKQDEL